MSRGISRTPEKTREKKRRASLLSWTEERRKRYSKMFSGKNNAMYGKFGKEHPCYGCKHPHSEKTKKIIREKRANQTTPSGWKQTKEAIEKIKLARANQAPFSKEVKKKMGIKISKYRINHPNRKFSNTKIEQKVAKELKNRGLVRGRDFYQNHGIKGIKNVDFFLPKLNTVIECDGCFYHVCPEHGNLKYHQTVPAKDARKIKELKKAGYTVYRFWEHEINESPERCINTIKFKI